VNWLGLDWIGICLNVFVLAIVPGLLAAYGGHLAAESISDPKRSRNVKLCFWALFLFGVVATFWQQFRAAQTDLDRGTNETWIQALATSKFLPPPPPANISKTSTSLVSRSYLIFDGTMRFGERRDNVGKLLPDQNLQVGGGLFFNYYYKATGPSPVQEDGNARLTILEPDFSPASQQKAIEYFKATIKKESRERHIKPAYTVFMPQDADHWDSARAWTEE
jgi:hypothetical protein